MKLTKIDEKNPKDVPKGIPKIKGQFIVDYDATDKVRLKKKFKTAYAELDVDAIYNIKKLYTKTLGSIDASILHLDYENAKNPYVANHFIKV